jgi:uncharacterized protein
MNFQSWFQARFSSIPFDRAQSVLKLTAEGATVPFIARYRKEMTGNMDEVGIQQVIEANQEWDHIIHRQQFILGEIDKQKKLTPELKETIEKTFDSDRLEDLYMPFKRKKKTKAQTARDAGLEPLAHWIWNCGHGTEKPQDGQTLELWAFTFRNEEKGVNDALAAIEGAQDIIVERLSEQQHLRQLVRDTLFKSGFMRTSKGEKAKENSKYENYFQYSESVESLLDPKNSHRYLAIRRGWQENELSLSIGGKAEDVGFEEAMVQAFEREAVTTTDSPGHAVLLRAARLAYKVHVLPSIENEVHKALKHVADRIAIRVFTENVRKLLLSAPLGPKAVLGVDPGIRTGCKLAMIESSGKYVGTGVIHLQTEDEKKKAKEQLKELLEKFSIDAIAVGNGTAGRETESFLRQAVKELGKTTPIVLVNESGASVYSASEVAREEFPDLDVTVRGAISIARRLQDPLAELVKVDPKSIGVGQYQHDVSPNQLKESLEAVVDSCVNNVGVNLNTASVHLLAHVSGIGPALAKAIVEHRSEKGLFQSRTQLLSVPRFGAKPFELAAGFLRIPSGENPLDNTGVHPERYAILENFAKASNKSVRDLIGSGVSLLKADNALKNEIGEYTFRDIIAELEKPGRDPRDTFVPFSFLDTIYKMEDVKPGMICPGIVTNVTNFGAFVDIGVHQDGLVHISQISDQFIKDPREALSPGDRVTVKVMDINLEKKQLSFSIKAAKEMRSDGPRHGRNVHAGSTSSPSGPARDGARRPVAPDGRRGPSAPHARSSGPGRGPRDGARPPRDHDGPRAARGGDRDRPPRAPRQPAFSNRPFEVLAELKKNLKQ